MLQEQKDFWLELCAPLTAPSRDTADPREVRVRALVLRVLATELYTWAGSASPALRAVLTTVCSEGGAGALAGWGELGDCSGDTTQSAGVTVVDQEPGPASSPQLFLLSSWRAFILVVSKDCPSVLTPAACRAVFSAVTSKLAAAVRSAPPPTATTVMLAETAAVLARRWRTKCTDSAAGWCGDLANLLSSLLAGWAATHPRAKLAVLALSLASLRMSQFKLEPGEEVALLAGWLQPSLALLTLSLRELEAAAEGGGEVEPVLPPAELSLALLTGLLHRLPPATWLGALHREAGLQLLLAAAGWLCRAGAAPVLARALLQLLADIAGQEGGAGALLLQDLAGEVWLPLARLGETAGWAEVRQAGLHLATALLRSGGRQAVECGVTCAALLQERIVGDLLAPRTGLDHLPGAAAAVRFVSTLTGWSEAWRSEHQSSLAAAARAAVRLLHTATALLMRPALLDKQMPAPTEVSEAASRIRRVSSAAGSGCEVEVVAELPPRAAAAYSALLEVSAGCLSLLSSLSPPLPALLAGEALLDPDRWPLLLQPGFSPPSLEQDGDNPSWGLLLALANTAVRTLGVDSGSGGHRSPSPCSSAVSPVRGRPGSAAPPPDTPERRRLMLVLERCLAVLLSQALLALACPATPDREKQLLRRELGAELASVTDSWRRQAGRGGRSPGPARSARSPAPLTSTPARTATKSPAPPPASPQPPRCNKDGSDQFMKFASLIVNNVFL